MNLSIAQTPSSQVNGIRARAFGTICRQMTVPALPPIGQTLPVVINTASAPT